MTAVLIILAAIVLLVIGYITYGSWLAKQWGIDPKRPTPAVTVNDGVDYVVMPQWKLFLVQRGRRPDQRTDSGFRVRLGAGFPVGCDWRHFHWRSA